MADDTKLSGDLGGLSGAELQQSQITGTNDEGFSRDAMQGEKGGTQLGGGPDESDMATPGGSSGTGGYGNAQNQASHQGQQGRSAHPSGHDMHQSRGELFDEQQGGGRDADSVSSDSIAQVGGSDGSFDQQTDQNELSRQADELLRNQQEHQDRGQSAADAADFQRDSDS